MTNINKNLVVRFEIERRNSFNPSLTDRFVNAVLANEDLISFLRENKIIFSKDRIKIIEDKLEKD